MTKSNPTIHVWITKYALTTGIIESDAEHCLNVSEKMIQVGSGTYYHGNDWHTSREAAVKRAEEMRNRKIRSIEKSLKQLRELTFDI